MGIKVLSLFDGIACARVALQRAGISVDAYYASEIDKYARFIAKKNWPDIVELGDVRKISGEAFKGIDLLIGGPPCQDLSIAKRNRKGLKGEQSSLFWEFVRLLRETQPKYFVMENVASMSKKDKAIITETLGVEPVMINAALVSAQQRKRLFWVGENDGNTYKRVEIPSPKDRGIYLKDILEMGFTEKDKALVITATHNRACPRDYFLKHNRQLIFTKPIRIGQIGKGGQGDRIYSIEGKSVCLSANGGGRGAKTGLYLIDWYNRRIKTDGKAKTLGTNPQCRTAVAGQSLTDLKRYVRKLTPIECERLQGLPDSYTEGISNTQRYKCLGNAFNVDVVAHVLSILFKGEPLY